MASKAPTAFLLVPGSFSPTLYYHKVTERLRAKGHEVIEFDLLTCVKDPSDARPAASMYEDAAALREIVETWADKGYDVVIGMNSYGGFCGSECAKGLGKPERARSGKKGGLVGLVMLASFLPDVGQSVMSIMEDNLPDQLKNPKGDYMTLGNKPGDGNFIFNLLNQEDSDHYISHIGSHSRRSYSDGITYPGWKYIPTTFFYTGKDNGLPPPIQKEMLAAAKKQGVDIKLVETDGDHVPMLSIPDDVTKVLLEAAGKA